MDFDTTCIESQQNTLLDDSPLTAFAYFIVVEEYELTFPTLFRQLSTMSSFYELLCWYDLRKIFPFQSKQVLF